MTLDGIILETSPEGIRAIAGATVELFIGEALSRTAVTNDAGRYLICFPQEALGPSGLTPPGQTFGLRARKDGFPADHAEDLPASTSFQYGYSKWDYGGMSLNLELVRQ